MASGKILKVACHGLNGHQILHELKSHPKAKLVAVSDIPPEKVKDVLGEKAKDVKICATLEELLQSDAELISLCSGFRREQPADAVKCLEAGKHVLAEKPCVFTQAELDLILATAKVEGVLFREMSGSEDQPPVRQMKEMIEAGKIGRIVQAWGQKSYPFHNRRPQDPDIDGGIFQAGLHALRFLEFLCSARVEQVDCMKTRLGNPVPGGALDMAASINLALTGGILANITVNYLNRSELGTWGNEQTRIFGTDGFIESTDGLTKGKLVNANGVMELSDSGKSVETSYFTSYMDLILEGKAMPTPFEIEKGFIEDTIKIMDCVRSVRTLA